MKTFIARIQRFTPFEIITLKDSTKEKEAELILKAVGSHFLIALDETGKQMTSVDFSKWLTKVQLSHKDIAFCIGGPDGLTDEIKHGVGQIISLSSMTLPHELAQLFFLEQLYRALAIQKNLPYHRG